MQIHMTPVEAYRQAGQALKRPQVTDSQNSEPDRSGQSQSLRTIAPSAKEIAGVRAATGPSFLNAVLTAPERQALLEGFGRFGDSADKAPVYNTRAALDAGQTRGLQLDVKV